MNHYKARIAELEASRLKLITDAREAREENEKLKAQLERLRAKVRTKASDRMARVAAVEEAMAAEADRIHQWTSQARAMQPIYDKDKARSSPKC